MTDINGFQLTGRIADNAKLSSTKNGTATLSFCLAVNRDRKVNEQWVSKGSFFYINSLWKAGYRIVQGSYKRHKNWSPGLY